MARSLEARAEPVGPPGRRPHRHLDPIVWPQRIRRQAGDAARHDLGCQGVALERRPGVTHKSSLGSMIAARRLWIDMAVPAQRLAGELLGSPRIAAGDPDRLG